MKKPAKEKEFHPMSKNKPIPKPKPIPSSSAPGVPFMLLAIIAKANGNPIVLSPTGKYIGFSISGIKQDIVIEGNGATVVGQMKFEDCGKVTIRNLTITDGNPYGVMIVKCAGFELDNLTIISPERSGILTANTSNGLIQNCRISGAKQQHGIYCSQSGDSIKILNNIILDCAYSGIQCNAVEDSANPNNPPGSDSISQNVVISGNKIDGCQKVGKAGAVQCSGVHTGEVSSNIITKHYGRNILTFWDDGTNNPALACKDISIAGNSGMFAAADKNSVSVNIGKNCTYHLGINSWQSGIKEMVQQ